LKLAREPPGSGFWAREPRGLAREPLAGVAAVRRRRSSAGSRPGWPGPR